MSTKQTGILGERIAENYLKKKGYQILDKNYPFRIPGNPQKGEIDIVVRKSDIISFIEVKTLRFTSFSGGKFFAPEAKVNFSKQRKLRQAAEGWLIKNKIPLNSKWQIDVMSVIMGKSQTEISHFENAISYQ